MIKTTHTSTCTTLVHNPTRNIFHAHPVKTSTRLIWRNDPDDKHLSLLVIQSLFSRKQGSGLLLSDLIRLLLNLSCSCHLSLALLPHSHFPLPSWLSLQALRRKSHLLEAAWIRQHGVCGMFLAKKN